MPKKKATKEEQAAYLAADMLKQHIAARLQIPSEDLVCPREQSFMTPCIARDGSTAVAFASGFAICAGCEVGVQQALEREQAKTG